MKAQTVIHRRHGPAVLSPRELRQLVQLPDLNKYPEAPAPAEQLPGILPDEPRLRKLLPEVSRLTNVHTTPPAPTVAVKRAAAADHNQRRWPR